MTKVCKICKEEKDGKEFDSRKLTCNTCIAYLKRGKKKKKTWMGFSSGKNKKVASQSRSPIRDLLCDATLENLGIF